jgi:acyl-CoA reductase-like NAD-dependent aldehyde dehydrogenase
MDMTAVEAKNYWKDDARPQSIEARAKMMLERAHWAATAFAAFDRERTLRIAKAAADAGFAKAGHYGEWAVRETGFGVAEHKRIKNELCSRGIYEHYRNDDFVGKRIDPERKIVEFARPAGVIFALVPSTNPVSTVFFKIVLALLTRNAIVISPHPLAKACCADAARLLGEAAQQAGAPDGVVQVVEDPTIPLIEALMSDVRTDVILATGGTAVVRAAYRSGNPAIGVGPGNAPVFVDATADLAKAAKRIVTSKSFDNSILCTNESVLVAEDSIAGKLERHLQSEGAHLCEGEDLDRLRRYVFAEGKFNLQTVGKDAGWIAKEAGVRVSARTRILLAPFALAVPEEPFAREKLCPVLGYVRVPHAKRGIDVSGAIMRMSGSGHSAAIHSRDPKTIMAFAANLRALRVAVNSPCSTGAAGFDTHLAPSMTIGTGYVGRSSVGDNIGPQHLVNWVRIAYDKDAAEKLGDFEAVEPWHSTASLAPEIHRAEGDQPADVSAAMREEIRKVILEELRDLFMGS